MIRKGDVIENPVTGERMQFLETSAETNGEYVLVEVTVQPNGFVAAAHTHPYQTERFEIESGTIAFQTCDVLEAMETELDVLRADGGAAANSFLMQLQADLARVPVEVAAEREATALGAASLAGLAVGPWPGLEALALARPAATRYEPSLDADEAQRMLAEWRVAVRRTLL